MLLPIDLHCHSIFSDGSHTIEDIFQAVKDNNGKYIAITDHDTISGLEHANSIVTKYELILINGVEISVTWDNHLIHIIGLNIDYRDQILKQNLDSLRNKRLERGKEIAKKLESFGIKGAFEGALKYCTYPESLSRTHFAKFLVDHGYARQNNVFNKFLAKDKIAYVKQEWTSLENAINWINNSGGLAIIAHPSRYKLNYTTLNKLILEFKLLGGVGIEVYSSSHNIKDINTITNLASKFNLLASAGNDFHNINAFPKMQVGLTPKLPERCSPIFSRLGIKDL
jgi:predicted metal-dependent phosphoesterase TrpH